MKMVPLYYLQRRMKTYKHQLFEINLETWNPMERYINHEILYVMKVLSALNKYGEMKVLHALNKYGTHLEDPQLLL